jgi:glutamyl-tRNA synthetase
MHINQVVRGVDLLSSTARQILLFEALDFAIPTFAHVPLLFDTSGKRLSKRIQSEGLDPLRATGLTPADVIGQLAASCGLIAPAIPTNFPELVARYYDQPYDIIRSKLYAL